MYKWVDINRYGSQLYKGNKLIFILLYTNDGSFEIHNDTGRLAYGVAGNLGLAKHKAIIYSIHLLQEEAKQIINEIINLEDFNNKEE